MKKFLNNPWVVTALAVAAIAFVWSALAPTTAPPSRTDATAALAPAPEETKTTTEAQLVGDFVLSSMDALKQILLPKSSRDPFAVRTAAEPTASIEITNEPELVETVHLSALWTQNGATLILINDHIRTVGDTLGRIKIESATQQGVWLSHKKGRSFLSLGKDFVLRTPVGQTAPISSP